MARTYQRRERWTAAALPDQSWRIAVVTGANTGLGLETARVLAWRGATVLLACRDLDKAERAAALIRAEVASANVRIVHLDLASLASVREAATEIRAISPRLDLLINNAGVMEVPYQRTEDGFELTLATNHLGHFALTGLVLDRLVVTSGSRIVTVSSLAHRRGVMHFDDLHFEQRYRPSEAYAQSKLANLLFTHELQSRLAAAGLGTLALAAHPGNARTDLWRTSSLLERVLINPSLRLLTFWLGQDPPLAALPTLRAAIDPSAQGGDYYGPSGVFEYTGYPIRVEASPGSHDAAAQRRLWEVSEQLTRVAYPLAVLSDEQALHPSTGQ
jgi:NAD(P)-dependent dehydrogenase (short-subunit alcohol dehydrogenase family)